MEYNEARRLMADGFYVRRPNWHESKSTKFEKGVIRIYDNKERTSQYGLTIEDILSDDWELFKEMPKNET